MATITVAEHVSGVVSGVVGVVAATRGVPEHVGEEALWTKHQENG